jgi:hypothetical protein
MQDLFLVAAGGVTGSVAHGRPTAFTVPREALG